ncbi:ferredoxin-type protein NapG [Neiella marina]|uniref:Ferredoxin-type protein NapG n=1 Tax=Neiella marina TaxID=508461 RepID=A0A8J2U870_9GAMM|nr:ferredoxin-type protein NapG [Neiella marina]GGA86042.1 ferredoxin-type protein NapG [Neiella marina]
MAPKSKHAMSRRQFLHNTAKGACVASVTVAAMGLVARPSGASSPQALRPPGAVDEAEFLDACVRCGLCVEACPYDTLKLATLFDAAPMGTPYFEARTIPCEMCDDIPCQQACPSGAISPELDSIDDARMGLAVLIDQETCLNWQGLRCDVCYRVCPLIDEAITLEAQRNMRTGHHAMFIPTVHSDACTGCGKCEQACVLEVSAIKVLSRDLAKGELGRHYRWGWKEKEKAGHSLLEQDVLDLPDRRPEGG